jgi:hypothetical protein
VSLSTEALTPSISHWKTASFENLRTILAFHFNLTFFHGRVSKRYISWRVQTFCTIKLPCSEQVNMGTVFSILRRWINRSIFFSSLFLRLFHDGVSAFCMKTSVARFSPWRKKPLLLMLFSMQKGFIYFTLT